MAMRTTEPIALKFPVLAQGEQEIIPVFVVVAVR
ncbi:hypothetical protein CY0110_18462 [Crocosphaera chwakensis CCY0110]|uniref:Uncharacterized protein n=1 Tax=Crocosphaera chwakensis CCY0110 TaxID=391612 RepID=A3IJ24_9CHRO|nr:hypothetical protein CY0110_18462 [Crocosphaera chwakensis CCY0110]